LSLILPTPVVHSDARLFHTLPPEQAVELLRQRGIQFPLIVYMQSVEETTYEGKPFNSRICIENNNYFGMKCSERRGICDGVNRDHAAYYTYDRSLEDYKLWQVERIKGHSRVFFEVLDGAAYLHLLENGVFYTSPDRYYTARYAENPHYIRNLKRKFASYRKKGLFTDGFLFLIGYQGELDL